MSNQPSISQTLYSIGVILAGGQTAPKLGFRIYYQYAGFGRDVQTIAFGAEPITELDQYRFACAKLRVRAILEEYGLTLKARRLDDAIAALPHTSEWVSYQEQCASETAAALERDRQEEVDRGCRP